MRRLHRQRRVALRNRVSLTPRRQDAQPATPSAMTSAPTCSRTAGIAVRADESVSPTKAASMAHVHRVMVARARRLSATANAWRPRRTQRTVGAATTDAPPTLCAWAGHAYRVVVTARAAPRLYFGTCAKRKVLGFSSVLRSPPLTRSCVGRSNPFRRGGSARPFSVRPPTSTCARRSRRLHRRGVRRTGVFPVLQHRLQRQRQRCGPDDRRCAYLGRSHDLDRRGSLGRVVGRLRVHSRRRLTHRVHAAAHSFAQRLQMQSSTGW